MNMAVNFLITLIMQLKINTLMKIGCIPVSSADSQHLSILYCIAYNTGKQYFKHLLSELNTGTRPLLLVLRVIYSPKY